MKRLLILVLVGIATWIWLSRPAAPLVLAAPPAVSLHVASEAEPPLQRDPPAANVTFHVNGYELRPLQAFALKARALSVAHYRMGREADLSPTDIAFGWGPMADTAMSDKLSISQSGRWYYWGYSGTPPLPPREIAQSSANMHLVPASAEVARALRAIDKGRLVSLRGYLVEARGKDGWTWRSSLSREDTGNGSCELVFVQSIETH